MLKNKFLLVVMTLMVVVGLRMTYAAGSSPENLLQNIADNMIAGLKKNSATIKSKPQIVYNLAYRYVVPYADLDQMSMRVMPPDVWRNATAAQRNQFKKEFTLTLIRTYASALSNYDNQTVKFYPSRNVSGNTAEIASDIIGPNNSIHVTYRLVRAGSEWKLLDMNVEGIGMLDSFRSQFADILSQGDLKSLLDKMSKHNS